ncbi:hypothetical protein [Vibrio campbellii]|nr:hypothetical protein [Vibrio campbellii]
MATTKCPNCGNTCPVIFRPYIHTKDGQIRYPKKSRVFPIPVCECKKTE